MPVMIGRSQKELFAFLLELGPMPVGKMVCPGFPPQINVLGTVDAASETTRASIVHVKIRYLAICKKHLD